MSSFTSFFLFLSLSFLSILFLFPYLKDLRISFMVVSQYNAIESYFKLSFHRSKIFSFLFFSSRSIHDPFDTVIVSRHRISSLVVL